MKTLTALVLVATITAAAPLRADELRVTGGWLDMSEATHSGSIVLAGSRGFTFQSRVFEFSGIFRPGDCNFGPLACVPGAVVNLRAVWSGADLTGTATLDSNTYADIGGANSPNSMEVQFSGSAVLPPLGTGGTIVSAPFILSGVFRHSEGAVETLAGIGTATIFLSPSPALPGGWHLDRVVYRLASAVPPPWTTANVGPAGNAGFASYLDGTFYVGGDGTDVWGTSDSFRFVYQPILGDADVVAHVATEDADHPFAKSGVMFRQSLDPSALNVILDRKPNGELEFMARFGELESTTYVGGAMPDGFPWLRISRSGNQFTAYYSTDGLAWTEVGSVAIAGAGFSLLGGIAVTSHDAATLNTSVFDHVGVRAPLSFHNLLQWGDFEQYVPPALGPPGWISDNPLRQIPAVSETHQPHSGTHNAACWTADFLDCGIYQEQTAPVTGSYAFRVFATADRPGGLVGVNLNGQTVASHEVEVRPFGDYAEYTMSFAAGAGDLIRVWMYSPPQPGYVVIDDASLTLDRSIAITQGNWTIGPGGPGQLGRFTLSDGAEVQVTGSYDGGLVEPLANCASTPCMAGQPIALRSFFENQTPLTIESFARGAATVGGTTYPFVEFGGALVLDGQTIVIPAADGTTFPERVQVSAPFTLSGDLKGFDVLGRRDPRLMFDLPLTGHGTATLELLTAPGPFGPVLNFLRMTYTFEP